MPEKQVKVKVTQKGGKRTSDKLKDVDKSLDRMRVTTKGLQRGMGVLRNKILLVTFAFGGMLAAAKKMINSSGEQERAIKKMETALESTKGIAGLTSKELQNMASALQEVTTFGDETILGAQSLLLTFTKIGKEVFPQATEAALDMSVAMGQDLQQTIIQVGKALNDPILGVTALRRVGVQLSETQTEQIKKFVELSDVASAQKIILGELSTQFGGQARAATDTMTGSLKQAANAAGDAGEKIGDLLAPSIIRAAQGFKGASEAISAYLTNLKLINTDILTLTETDEKIAVIEAQLAKARNRDVTNRITGLVSEKKARQRLIDINKREQELKSVQIDKANELASLEFDEMKRKEAIATIIEGDIIPLNMRHAELLAEQVELYELLIGKTESQAISYDFLDDKQRAIVNGFESMSRNMASAILNAKSMEDAVVSSLKAIAAEMLAQAAIFALLNLFTGGAFGATQSLGGFLLSGFKGHDGGMVTPSGIQKFHQGGLANNEQLAVLLQDEGVLNRQAVKNIGGPQGLNALNRGEQSAGQQVVININGGIVDEDYLVNEFMPAFNKARALA